MRVPKSFIRNRLFEIGRTIVSKPRKKTMEFCHKRLAWWINVYEIRFKHIGYYLIVKKICF
jgi:hypothetical protein